MDRPLDDVISERQVRNRLSYPDKPMHLEQADFFGRGEVIVEAGIAVRTTGSRTTQERYIPEGLCSSPWSTEEAYALSSSPTELSLDFKTQANSHLSTYRFFHLIPLPATPSDPILDRREQFFGCRRINSRYNDDILPVNA